MVVSFPSPTCTSVSAASFQPVAIDVGRLRQIMDTVRRMGDGDEVKKEADGIGVNEHSRAGRSTVSSASVGARPVHTVHTCNDSDGDIASSRSQSPDLKATSQRTRTRTNGSIERVSVAHIPATETRSSASLTPDELYHAKVLILDLLGWGVPPEYILQRGVSHELLCSIFTDLRLRLPENIAADYTAIKTYNAINRV